MSNGGVTRDELWDVRNSIVASMNQGFAQITARLDVLNGRVGKAEVEAGKHDVRIIGLERRDRRLHARRTSDMPRDESGENRRITQRDVRLILAGVGGTLAVLGFLWKVLPAVLRAL